MQVECLGIGLLCVEHALVETGGTSVKAVGVIVDGQSVLLAVKCELAVCNAVAVTADEYAQECLLAVHDMLDAVMSPYHALHLSVAVRHHDCAQRTGKVGYGYLCSPLVLEYVKICFLTLDCGLEILSFEAGQILFYKEIAHIV